mmetsp:Transcript_84611/g.239839  ORF Transcript_84611/g.239839 Transcript_84611/m.239839 type:complete len:83 (+) Transcript_84611:99-347(+)
MTFDTGKNKGFAFVNFVAPDVAVAFADQFRQVQALAGEPLERPLRVTTAEVQGYEANAAKAHSKKMSRVRNNAFRPLLATQR